MTTKICGTNLLPRYYYHNGAYFAQFLLFECPGKCDFCIIHGRGLAPMRPILPATELLNFWNNLAHIDGYSLSLLGGEPTLRSDIIEIVNNLDGYFTTITSNLGTAFYDDPSNLKNIRKKNFRINTSFHPRFITVEKFITRFKKIQDAGIYIGQLDLVNHPDVDYSYFRKEFEKCGLNLVYVPYLGFYKDGKFPGCKNPDNALKEYGYEELQPGTRRKDWNYIKQKCGIRNYKRFKLQCGASTPRTVMCDHYAKCLLIAPDGKIHDCHYKLYYDKDSYSDIWNLNKLKPTANSRECNYFGFCNWCDLNRVTYPITGENTPKEVVK